VDSGSLFVSRGHGLRCYLPGTCRHDLGLWAAVGDVDTVLGSIDKLYETVQPES
jgi:hypothetical protein